MPPESETPPRSLAAVLGDLYLAPGEAFTELARHPRPAVAMLGFLLVQGSFMATWLTKVDMLQFMRAQAEAAGRPGPPPGAFDSSAMGAFKWITGVSGVAVSQIVLLAFAGLLLFLFNFMLGSGVKFRQCLSVVAWTTLATSLVTTTLLLTVLALRGEWSVSPEQVVQANLGLFVERASAGAFLHSLAGSLDVFSLWMLFLTTVGMSKAAKVSTGASAAVIVGLWLLYVLGKAALAAAF
jgi:hypothetical protein